MEVRFSNPIDQHLYELILNAEPNFEDCRAEGEALLALGANINAPTVDGAIPNGFMLAALLQDASPNYRSDIVRFFLRNGFDPHLAEGAAGSQALSHLIWLCFPGQATLDTVKALLRAGCDPLVKTLFYDDDPDESNAVDQALIGLADAFDVHVDFLDMLGFSAIFQCLRKAGRKEDFAGVGLVTDAFNCPIRGIYAFGDCAVSKNEAEASSFSFVAAKHRPFEAGLIFDCDRTCLLIDPFWGAFCDTELAGLLSSLTKIDPILEMPRDLRLTSISGKICGSAEFLLDCWYCAMEIRKKTIKVKERPQRELQHAASLLVPNGI